MVLIRMLLKAMKEVGIDISHHTSDLINNDILIASDIVVTLCSDADANCPVLPKTSLKNIGDLMILLVKIGQNFNV